MLRALFWMTSNFTTCVILTDLWWRIIMERNGSFVSGYLCEILPSAKEPRGDLHVTQNSSEARPNNAFSRKGQAPVCLSAYYIVQENRWLMSHTQWAGVIPGRWPGVFLDQWSTNFVNGQIVNVPGFVSCMSSLWHILCFLLQILHKCKNNS